jgi:serine/threonine-protein kinase
MSDQGEESILRQLPTESGTGGTFAPPSVEELATRLPNLEVLELIGHGGMGVVYKGRQPFLDRQVAIKLIRPDFDNDDSERRFIGEARSLAKLMHPNIVTVFDCGKSGDLCYFVMEYVEGTSLRQLIAQKSVSERDVLDFVPQIGEALRHAHDSGVIHRDVKPENIVVDRQNRVRLVDFGLAILLNPKGKRSSDDSRIAGTLGYMAPEQLSMPEKVDHRADIYSTGVVCFEMLTGELPRTQSPAAPSSKAAIDRRFDPIVLRALERDRERRYQQIGQMNDDVAVLTRTPESTIRLETSVAAAIEQVFAAWTNPEQMTRWYAPTDDFTTPIAEVDLRVGGTYKVGMKHKDRAFTNIVTGQYCRIEPPHRLSFTWAWEAPKPDQHETQVTLEFQAKAGSTHVTLLHERFRDEGSRQGHTEGWTGCLSRLAREIARQ